MAEIMFYPTASGSKWVSFTGFSSLHAARQFAIGLVKHSADPDARAHCSVPGSAVGAKVFKAGSSVHDRAV